MRPRTVGEWEEAPLAEIVESHFARERLATLLRALPPRERALPVLRYGLDGAAPRTLKEVGAALGLGDERARQLESHALLHLRQHPLAATLRDSLG